MRAFTLIEIMLVVAVITALGALSVPFATEFVRREDSAYAEMVAVASLRQASERARSMVHDGAWGVRFGESLIVVFQGETYSGRDQSLDEETETPSSMVFGGDTEVVFGALTGETGGVFTITITNVLGDQLSSLTVNEYGTVLYE